MHHSLLRRNGIKSNLPTVFIPARDRRCAQEMKASPAVGVSSANVIGDYARALIGQLVM